MKFVFKLVFVIGILSMIVSQKTVSNKREQKVENQKRDDEKKLFTPEIIKNDPIFYNGPPNFNDKKIHEVVDAFNPGHHPENIAEYPEYDVLPAVNHFYEGVVNVNLKHRVEPGKVEEHKNRLEEEFKELVKELFENDEEKLNAIRKEKTAYDSEWLRENLKINKIIELEEFIQNNKNKKN